MVNIHSLIRLMIRFRGPTGTLKTSSFSRLAPSLHHPQCIALVHPAVYPCCPAPGPSVWIRAARPLRSIRKNSGSVAAGLPCITRIAARAPPKNNASTTAARRTQSTENQNARQQADRLPHLRVKLQRHRLIPRQLVAQMDPLHQRLRFRSAPRTRRHQHQRPLAPQHHRTCAGPACSSPPQSGAHDLPQSAESDTAAASTYPCPHTSPSPPQPLYQTRRSLDGSTPPIARYPTGPSAYLTESFCNPFAGR